jgi:hypothetical protein
LLLEKGAIALINLPDKDSKTSLHPSFKEVVAGEKDLALSQLEASDLENDATITLHLLPDHASKLASGEWRILLPLLLEFLCSDTEYKSHGHRYSCWTFTPSTPVDPAEVPFYIAGAPVVIPVDYWYPLMGSVAPPSDPYPSLINPEAPLNIQTIAMIFKHFDQCLGFYFLLNGMLQIVVPKDFGYEWASSYRPNIFGGLKVCYISESMAPTKGSSCPTTSDLKLDHQIEARVKNVVSQERHAGRIGIKTMHKSKEWNLPWLRNITRRSTPLP